MDKLDFSALCSRPYSQKSGACVEDVSSITSAVQDFPLPQVQDVSFYPVIRFSHFITAMFLGYASATDFADTQDTIIQLITQEQFAGG